MTSIDQTKRIKELEERNEKLYEANVELRKNIERSQIRINELEEVGGDLAESAETVTDNGFNIVEHTKNAQAEAIGWAHADACCDLDAGRDPRQKNCPDMLARFLKDTADVMTEQSDAEETAGAEDGLMNEVPDELMGEDEMI